MILRIFWQLFMKSIATLAYVEWYKFDRNFAICQKIKNFDRRVKAPGLRLLCGVLYALP